MRIVTGLLKGRKIQFFYNDKPRPTKSIIRESLFNILSGGIKGARFLDLFSGTGAVGMEAYSRGASRVCFVEKDRKLALSIKKNLQIFELPGEVFIGNYKINLTNLRRKKYQFKYIYMDPPYSSGYYQNSVGACLSNNILIKGGLLIIEHHKNEDPISTEFLKKYELELKDKRRYGITSLTFYSKNNNFENG